MSWKKTALWCLIIGLSACNKTATVSLKTECLHTMRQLVDALLTVQNVHKDDKEYGGLFCASCGVYHTRAAEAVYPMAVAYRETGDRSYLDAAINLGHWLLLQQQADGSWKETPEEWTGTTTDQLLMLLSAFPILQPHLTQQESVLWKTAMHKAADYLTNVMSPDFASINYCATSAATLALMHRLFPDEKYQTKARWLARQTAAKMEEEGFIHAEGDRSYNVKYGADIGYEIDMSLWGLALYARLTADSRVDSLAYASLLTHLYFVYPNGAIDGSWGIRSNKWTTYGSKTADGCQILFGLFAAREGRCRTAAWRNLLYLRTMMKDGFIGYGPQYWQLFSQPPCLYPTFVRSKNLALAAEWGEPGSGSLPKLFSDETGWMRHFPTVDVCLVRTKTMMATISNYHYQDLQRRSQSKYMHRPAGGSLCNLWVQDHGFLQISSQTEYHRSEPMHFPPMDEILPLTPRIEFFNHNGYFTNLYEFDGRMAVQAEKEMVVSTAGELCDHNFIPGGVAYRWSHRFDEKGIEKTVDLRYHDGPRAVRIVEPIVWWPDMHFTLQDARTVLITTNRAHFSLQITSGDVECTLGEQKEKYRWPFPAMRAFPIVLKVHKPDSLYRTRIVYRLNVRA